MAEATTEGTEDPDPLSHRYPAGQLHVPVAHFWVIGENAVCLFEQHRYALACNLFCSRIF